MPPAPVSHVKENPDDQRRTLDAHHRARHLRLHHVPRPRRRPARAGLPGREDHPALPPLGRRGPARVAPRPGRLGAARRRRRAEARRGRARSRRGAARPTTRSAAGTACARATGAASGCTCRRCWSTSAWPSSPTTPATTRSARGDPWHSSLRISIDLGEALGTDFFTVREQFTDEQWDRFITTRRFVDNEVLPVVADYWERAELAWPLIRRLPELGIVGEGIKGYGARRHERDGVRAGAHGAAPRRRQPRHVPRRARGPGHAVDRDVRLGGAEGPLAAVHVDDGEDRRLRAHRARPRLGLDRAVHHRPPRRRPLGARREQALDRQRHHRRPRRRLGPRHRRRPRSRASSSRRPPRATKPP